MKSNQLVNSCKSILSLLIFSLFIFIAWGSGGESEYDSSPEFREKVDEAIAAGRKANDVAVSTKVYEEACKRSWQACEDNGDYVDIHGGTSKEVWCEDEAEKRARGKVEWPSFSFGSYLTGDSIHEDGTITIIENDALFQNGFGAMMRMRVECTVDVRSKEIVGLDIK